jgi:hypothetical protein
MSVLSESLAIGIFLALLFGAACFYLYSRISYTEKRLSMMESLLVDIKMMIESAEHDAVHGVQAMPLTPSLGGAPYKAGSGGGELAKPIEVSSLPTTATEEDESMYNSVLEEAAAAAAAAVPSAVAAVEESQKVGPNYDAMTRAELATLADQRGIRVNKRAGRGEIITLLRKSDSSKNDSETTGTENGSAGSLFQSDGPAGGDLSVDSGNAGAALEEAAI